MTEKMRADFEAWYEAEYQDRPDDFKRFGDSDEYLDPSLNADWQVWKAATLKAQQWQPIETAPELGAFSVYMPTEREGRRVQTMKRGASFTTIGDHFFSFDCETPTHWQPLPLPPTATQEN